MAAPSIRSLGTVTSGSTGTPSFAEPAGAVADDVIACIWFQDDARTSIGTPPTGFAQATDAPQANNPLTGSSPDHSLQVYVGRRSAVGAGPYTFTVVPGTGGTTPFCEGRAVAIQDVPTTVASPFTEAADGNTTGSTSSTTAPAVSATSLGPDRLALYAATNWNGGAWTEPSGYTEQWDANNRIATFDSLTLTTAQTTSPQAVCAGNNRMNAWVGIFPSATADLPTAGPPRIPLHLLQLLLTRRQSLLDAVQATFAASGSATSTAHPTTTATGAKTAAGTATSTARPTTTATGRKGAAGTAASQPHPTTAATGLKTGQGAGAATARNTVVSTTIPRGPGIATARATTSSTGKKTTAGAGLAQPRPSTQTSGTKTSSGQGRAQAHPISTSNGGQVTLHPVYAGIDNTTSSTGIDNTTQGSTTDGGSYTTGLAG